MVARTNRNIVPARFTRSGLLLLLAGVGFLGLFAPACDDGKPKYTLRQVMFEMQHADEDVKRRLSSSGAMPEVVSSLRKIESWMTDPSVDRYLDSKGFDAGRIEEFRNLQTAFGTALTETIRAAEASDTAALPRTYARMRMSCEVCHQKFRPGI